MMSTCVKWAKGEVETFNQVLARQLSSTERDGEAWTKCMDRAKEHAAMLSDVGLDFTNLVGRDVDGALVSPNNVGLGVGAAS